MKRIKTNKEVFRMAAEAVGIKEISHTGDVIWVTKTAFPREGSVYIKELLLDVSEGCRTFAAWRAEATPFKGARKMILLEEPLQGALGFPMCNYVIAPLVLRKAILEVKRHF